MERLVEALPTIYAKQQKLRINFQLKQLFFATFFFCFCTYHSFHILTNWFETFIVNSLLRMSLSVSQLIKGYSNNINCILERLLVDIRYRTCASPDTRSHPLDLAIRSLIYVFIYLFIYSFVRSLYHSNELRRKGFNYQEWTAWTDTFSAKSLNSL